LWLTKGGKGLNIQLLGTQDKVTVQNWFAGSSDQVEKITASDGKSLSASKVNATGVCRQPACRHASSGDQAGDQQLGLMPPFAHPDEGTPEVSPPPPSWGVGSQGKPG